MSSESEPELVGEWREFTVQDPPVDAEGNDLSRVDRWLHQHFPRLSRSLLQKYIQDGRVHVDGTVVKPSFALKLGHRVKFCVPPPRRKLPIPQDIPLEVIHEDDDLIVIAKPAGLVVHGSPGVAEAGSLVNALLNHTDQLSQEAGTYRPGIVHRLDRETSGVIIVARNDTAHRHVGDQFRARTVAKEYVAFSHGVPKESEGEVDLPLGRSPATPRKRTVRYDSEGKEARTRWRAEASRGGFTRFRLFPSTGRTHQIRVHLQRLGHPILCDHLYGREKKLTVSEFLGKKPKAGEEPVLERHALHAHRISFEHPADGRPLTFEAPLPPDMAALDALIDEPDA